MTDKTEYEMAHTYLRMQYYNYECADKQKIDKEKMFDAYEKTDPDLQKAVRLILKI